MDIIVISPIENIITVHPSQSIVEIVEARTSLEIISPGVQGIQGPVGQGVPAGGTTGQYLSKNSNDDFDTDWTDPSGAVSSVSNSDGTLTISPSFGAVVASLNLNNENLWNGAQRFTQIQYFNEQVFMDNNGRLYYPGGQYLVHENGTLHYPSGAVLADVNADLYGSEGVVRLAANGDFKYAMFAGNGTFVDLLGNGYYANGNQFFDPAGRIFGDGENLYNVNHSILTNLLVDTHTQYALMEGRAGGQTIYGGTNANDDLYLEPTAHATKTSAKLVLASLGGEVAIAASGGKIGMYGVAGITRPTTGIAAATFVANTSGIANNTATWDGYTIGQIVKALRDLGILT